MNYMDFEKLTATTSTGPSCEHANGWYREIQIWFLRKRFFICSDCCEAIPAKEHEKEWKKKRSGGKDASYKTNEAERQQYLFKHTEEERI